MSEYNGYSSTVNGLLKKTNALTARNKDEIDVEFIVDELKEQYSPDEREIISWRESLPPLIVAIRDAANKNNEVLNCYIIIEYKFSILGNRIDVMLIADNKLILFELKQWGDDYIRKINLTKTRTYVNKDQLNPIYQLENYIYYLKTCHSKINDINELSIHGIVYLHNASSEIKSILSVPSKEDISLFCNDDLLSSKIKDIINSSAGSEILKQHIMSGSFLPNIDVATNFKSFLKENSNLKSIELSSEQQDIFDEIVGKIEANNDKKIFVIEGGPGTGKTILAAELLHYAIENNKNNSLYSAGTMQQKYLASKIQENNHVFKYLDNLVQSKNANEIVIADEAHRIKKSMFPNYLSYSRNLILLIDPLQQLYPNEIGNFYTIMGFGRNEVRRENIHYFKLNTQIRNNLSQNYINFVNYITGFSKEPVSIDSVDDYDIKIFKKNQYKQFVDQMHDKKKRNATAMVQGTYRFNNSRGEYTTGNEDEILRETYRNQPLLMSIEEGYSRVGTAESILGLETDYIGVFIGNDIQFNSEMLIFQNGNPRNSMDYYLRQQLIIEMINKYNQLKNTSIGERESETIIKDIYYRRNKAIKSFEDYILENLSEPISKEYLSLYSKFTRIKYRILLTRGRRGCFLFLDN